MKSIQIIWSIITFMSFHGGVNKLVIKFYTFNSQLRKPNSKQKFYHQLLHKKAYRGYLIITSSSAIAERPCCKVG